MKSRGLEVRMIPFVDRPEEHDGVISEVVTHIQTADVLVAVTATSAVKHPSMGPRFYESEILAATVAHKPVVLLGRGQNFCLPPTAYQGYPVLNISSLETRDWAPLATIVHLAVGTKTTVTQALTVTAGNSVFITFAIWGAGIVMWPLVVVLEVLVVAAVAWFRGVQGAVWATAAFRNTFSALLLGVLSISVFAVLLAQLHKQLRLRRKFRDDFARRNMTNHGLATLVQDLGGGDGIIDCLLASTDFSTTPGEVGGTPTATRRRQSQNA
jgi:hypothetical protein